jgi:hypothetical protein
MSTTAMPRRLDSWVRRIGVLLLASIPLWLIYSNPPLELSKGAPGPTLLSPAPADASEINAARLQLDEHRKVTDEIKMHLEEENQLFRYKFALLGGLLLVS